MSLAAELGDQQASLRASRDPSERGLLAQILGTENYRNVSEERPQNRQADKLGTRVYRSCTKVGAVTLVGVVTPPHSGGSLRGYRLSISFTRVPNASAQ